MTMSVPEVRNLLLAVMIVMNVVSIIAMGWDKSCAKNEKRRVPEAFLMLLAVLGGSIGTLASMVLFKHKTSKPLFRFGVPAVILVQAALLVIRTMGL